ncbi:MAG: response regulator [Myxococcales bacterium]
MDEQTFRILLIEDEPVIRELVRTMLTGGGVEVECVKEGTEGIRLARQKKVDLVLLDIVLPGMDGISVCRVLRSDPATSRVPIYMLTAKAKPADVEAARRAGASGYIHKPFKGAELMDLVDKLRSGAA